MEGITEWLGQKVKRTEESCSSPSPSENGQERSFLEDGNKLLEELIISCNGRCNPIRSVFAYKLWEPTNDFQQLYFANDFDLYKGVINGRTILIKRCSSSKQSNAQTHQKSYMSLYRNFAISSLMSSHNNVLKLLGGCLELPNPMLVYEYVENMGPLNAWGWYFGSDGSSLSWKTTLKVAKDIANAVNYLHTAFPRPIIHLNIKLENVFLDKNPVAKLSDFSCSMTIPEGESVVKVEGMDELVPVYIDHVYVPEGDVSEQSGVYSFGIFYLSF